MRGVSRQSFAELRDQLPEVLAQGSPAARPPTAAQRPRAGTRAAAGAASGASIRADSVGDELFSVLHLLDTEHGLRRALADPARPADEKGSIVVALLHGKISEPAEQLVTSTVRARWASPGDMTDALEQLATEAYAMSAEEQGQLDDLEDELFRFSRVVATEPDLRAALTEPSLPAEGKQGLLDTLLGGKVTPATLRLTSEMSLHPRGRSLVTSLETATRIAAERRRRLIAVVRSATELSVQQRQRLASALAGIYGHDVYINVVIDPTVVGGLTVQVGDELIDGSVASRLGSLRRKLTN
ncbi:MAG: F0F1 ATP synthase subunit delta [Actinobacteria bacterium]|nr:F0F1 ATP synthase subunit delta [Actinomycetota bacterium]